MGKTHYKWPFSIAMLNYQRVCVLNQPLNQPEWGNKVTQKSARIQYQIQQKQQKKTIKCFFSNQSFLSVFVPVKLIIRRPHGRELSADGGQCCWAWPHERGWLQSLSDRGQWIVENMDSWNSYMGMDQYLLIPFLGGWTSIYQLFWCPLGVQGFDTLPYNNN